MRLSLSLTQRYLLFTAITISVLFVGSLVITSSVIRSQLSAELHDRMNRSQQTLDQYARLHLLSQSEKLEGLLKSPRFMATIATADSATIAEQAPAILAQTDASQLQISDPAGRLLFGSNAAATEMIAALKPDSGREQVHIRYAARGDTLIEIVSGDVITDDHVRLGTIAVMSPFSARFVDELKRVCDFDVILGDHGHPISATESAGVTRVLAASWGSATVLQSHEPVVLTFGDEEIMLLTVPTPFGGTSITFVASLDDRIAPIVGRIRVWLVILSVIGALLATAAISWYTEHYLGRQISHLVDATGRIASGDIVTPVYSRSRDELGQLAERVESMRVSLLDGRAQLEKAHQETLSSERHAAIGKLAAGIIHDFKNPMAVIKGTAELIPSRLDDREKLTVYAGRIRGQVDQMVELTRDVLEYSRGNVRLDLAPVSLGEYLQEITEYHRHQFQEASIGLAVRDGVAVTIPLDRSRLKRVLDNILTNAREACQPGMSVTLQWHRHDDGVMLEIEDNGPGIPPEILPTLFDPFVTSGKEHGTGLGLAIAKKIVQDHGGEITVASSPGIGTTFRLKLPISAVAHSSAENASTRR